MKSAAKTVAITVSEYASQIGHAVRHVGGAVVEGEVQKPRKSPRGMLYLDLTDGDAKLSCKIFGRQLKHLDHQPKEGDLVRATVERPDFWAAAGKVDLVVSNVELAGEGELLRRRAALLERLRAEGLCDPDRRKPLPAFPRAVGVIAGKGSDGMSDVIRAIQDRFPPAHIVTCAAVVQGKSAPRDVIDALATLQSHPLIDVIVIARGGGSVQDLIAFDDERLCRAIFACDLPVVTAIGHTDNVPVCNHVTHAAFTPSRSAEMVVPSIAELRQSLTHARGALDRIPERVEHRLERVQALRERLRVPERLESWAQGVRELSRTIEQTEDVFFTVREKGLAEARAAIGEAPHRALMALSEQERQLAEQRPRLASAPGRFEQVAVEISEESRRLRAGILRQLVDHERDYRRAVDRLISGMKAAALRRFDDELERVSRAGQLVYERVGRWVDGVEGDLFERGRRVRAGIARQLADHDRDYQRAVDRLISGVRATALRSLQDASERVTRAGQLVHERSFRRIDGVERELSEESRRLRVGIARRLSDHERDYQRVVERLASGIKATALRCFQDPLERVTQARQLIYERVFRRVDGVERELSEEGRRLRAGILRQLVDHERDYRRAVDRLISGMKAAALRRFDDELERVSRAGQLVYERVFRRAESAERELRYVTALIAARDFRRQGFVLATDMAGRVVPSVAGLGVGARLNLNFHDGQVEAAVDKIKENRQ